jgi:hypothetical protein
MKPLKNPQQVFPLIITEKLNETKQFYLAAGFRVRFDLPHYLQVAYDGNLDLCFMPPEPGGGKQYAAFQGKGVLISIPTKNADEKLSELKERKLPIVSDIEDKPWGWRSFHTLDPNGVILDFFHVYKEVPMPNEQG